MQQEFFFDHANSYAADGIEGALRSMTDCALKPVVLCIGSDITSGDCLGPLVGTLLEEKGFDRGFLYGTLARPITAKEVAFVGNYLEKVHPGRKVIAVDAAVGKAEEVGLIKLQPGGLYPGIGVGKKLSRLGDYSVMGIVAPKTNEPFRSLQATRFRLVYKFAAAISEGIRKYLARFDEAV